MKTLPGSLRVGWKVGSLSMKMASVRYRALLPALALEGAHVRSRVFSEFQEDVLDGLDAVVIVKSFTADDLLLAQQARARGTKVFFDLCDNIFIEGYGGNRKGLVPAGLLQGLAPFLDAIVVTTEPLAEAVREHVPGVQVRVVPDGIETPGMLPRMREILERAAELEAKGRVRRVLRRRLRNGIHLIRDEGWIAVPVLVRSLGRKVLGAVARRLRPQVRARAPLPSPAPAATAVAAVPSGDGVPRIVWFGNHGAEHGRFGMLDLLEWRAPLEALARERAVELIVISNHLEKFERSIRPLAIPSRYVEWSPGALNAWLEGATAVLVPNSGDPFSLCKSANRSVLALAKGLPVVATPTPALLPLAGSIELGDPLEALRRVLDDPASARARAREGYQRAEALFGAEALQSRWLELLESQAGAASDAMRAPELVVLLHLVQDLDLGLPILREAREAGVSCQAWCTAELLKKSPRVLVTLKGQGFDLRVLPGEEGLGGFRFASETRALLTVAETSLSPHRIPRLLTEAALRQGIRVATLQHGYENVGLTYEDNVHSLEKVNIAAPRIYTWGPLETLHPRAGSSVRSRCVPVGCPKEARVPPADVRALLPLDRPVVGVFENLHWHRYSDAYRAAFLDNVTALARNFPHVCFLVKPHHAGMWLSHRYQGDLPDAGNLLIADPKTREWERHTATALLPHLSAVVTTPSTVALDAARQGIPTAVFAGTELALENYAPLPLLTRADDWTAFVGEALDPARRGDLQARSERFVERVLVPGNAARRIVEDLSHATAA